MHPLRGLTGAAHRLTLQEGNRLINLKYATKIDRIDAALPGAPEPALSLSKDPPHRGTWETKNLSYPQPR